MHSTVHTYIQQSIHTYIHHSIHTFTTPYMHSTVHTCIQQSIHTFNNPCIHSTIHTYIHSINAYIHQSIHTFNSPYKHTHIQSIHTFTSLYIHSSVHTFTSPYVHHFHTHLKYLGMTSLEEFEAYWRSKSRALNWPCFDWKYWQTQKGFFSLFLRIVFSIISGDEKNVLEVQRTSTSSTSATISRTGLVKNNLDIVH